MRFFLSVSNTVLREDGSKEVSQVYGVPEIEITLPLQVCSNCNSIIIGQNAPKCLCGQTLAHIAKE